MPATPMTSRRVALATATALLSSLAACSTPPAAAPISPPMADPDTGKGSCNADAVKSWVGRTADEAVVREAVAAAGAKGVRVIKPGMAVTMDFRADRLNLEVDAANVITSARCG